jgi:hypothetical protein
MAVQDVERRVISPLISQRVSSRTGLAAHSMRLRPARVTLLTRPVTIGGQYHLEVGVR